MSYRGDQRRRRLPSARPHPSIPPSVSGQQGPWAGDRLCQLCHASSNQRYCDGRGSPDLPLGPFTFLNPPGCLCKPLPQILHASRKVSSLPFSPSGPLRGPRTWTGLGKLTLPGFDLVHASCLRTPLAWRTHGGAGLPALSRYLDAPHGRANAQRGGENGGREGDSWIAGDGRACALRSPLRSPEP